jgi:LysR family transcriptional regulator, glycine cleavage system transcriptional activator
MIWRDMPSLSALRAFSAYAQNASFSRAGEALNVSHAAISQHVRALEDQLGVLLVVRNGRRSTLTPEGLRLARTLDSSFAAMFGAVEELRGSEAARPLQVSLTPAFGVRWLMPRIGDFRHRHPEIELMLNPTAELVELKPGGVDVAIRFGRGHWPGLDAEMLLPTSHAIVAATSLVGAREIGEPRDILDLPWLQEYGTNEMTLWLQTHGVLAPKIDNLTHLPGYMVLEGLMNGEGVSAVARALVEPEIESGRLRVLFEDTGTGSGYHVVTRPGVLRPAARAFVSWLRHQARFDTERRAGPEKSGSRKRAAG